MLRVTTALLLMAGAAAAQDTTRIQALEREVAAQRHLLRDWAGLTRYGSDDAEVRPPAPGENRVVFLGDQITEDWPAFFPGRPYLNRGIAGQTTPQMLVRFRQDVISLKPNVVVIHGGNNDLAGVAGPATDEMIADNVMSMTELARAHGIRVVIASVNPVCDCFPDQPRRRRMQPRIREANDALKAYAARSGSVYLDYFSALADGDDLKKEFTRDGLLPNEAGYRVMARLARQAIAEALGKP